MTKTSRFTLRDKVSIRLTKKAKLLLETERRIHKNFEKNTEISFLINKAIEEFYNDPIKWRRILAKQHQINFVMYKDHADELERIKKEKKQ